MGANGTQDRSTMNEPLIVGLPETDRPPSFRDHHDKLDRYVQVCNDELLTTRGLHGCEASVHANWRGQAILRREEMTSAVDPKTLAPLTMAVETPLDLPWLMPCDRRESAGEILTAALHRIEMVMREQCVRNGGLLRQSFTATARKMSRIMVPPDVDAGR